MITFLTTAKPFEGTAKKRQRNSIFSWMASVPGSEVLLFGDGVGYQETAAEMGLRRVQTVLTGPTGLPRIDSMFSEACRVGRYSMLAYVNADIMLTPDLLSAAAAIKWKRFVMVAQHWDLPEAPDVDSCQKTWVGTLGELVKARAQLHGPDGIDIFVWKGDVWKDLPPMVVGRGGFDNWLIYYCRKKHIPVVDATPVLSVFHQSHDYDHVPGGRAEVMRGAEARENIRQGGGEDHLFTVSDCDWILRKSGLHRNLCRGDAVRCAEVYRIIRGLPVTGRFRWPIEAWYELLIRAQRFRDGDLIPLLKYLPWLLRRICRTR